LSSALHVKAPAGGPLADRLARLVDLLPWLRQNALVHYLAPRGLEQFSGGGWGTRDVCQGPVETAARARPHRADARLAVARDEGATQRWRLAAVVSCSSSAMPASVPMIRTATSSSGRCLRSGST